MYDSVMKIESSVLDWKKNVLQWKFCPTEIGWGLLGSIVSGLTLTNRWLTLCPKLTTMIPFCTSFREDRYLCILIPVLWVPKRSGPSEENRDFWILQKHLKTQRQVKEEFLLTWLDDQIHCCGHSDHQRLCDICTAVNGSHSHDNNLRHGPWWVLFLTYHFHWCHFGSRPVSVISLALLPVIFRYHRGGGGAYMYIHIDTHTQIYIYIYKYIYM